MISDISKWKIIDNKLDTSEGDRIIEQIHTVLIKEYKKNRNLMPKPRIKLTEKERKQHIKEYQHEYYLKVTKLKRKGIYDNPELLEKGIENE